MPNKTTTHFSARKRLIVVAISACFVSAPAWSNPTAPQVVNGSASFGQKGNLLTVTNGNGAIINWNTFSIGTNETTRFNQTSAASSVLNRVLANDPSVLLGTLSSNGRVWLVNPAGIMVGQGARIDVAGFIASTLNVRNEDFLANRLNFQATPNAGKIENYGQITTPSGGSVYLIAPAVENHGIINAPNGEVILAAGQTAQLLDTGTPGVKVDITGAEGNVTNLGQIISEAGRIGMAGVLVRNSGTLNASSLVTEGGRIFLKASQDAYVDGAGRIVATGTKGGSIEVLGNRVAVMDQAQLDSSGSTGGGTVLVGGDAHGANPDVQNAQQTLIGPDAVIRADAKTTGDGGRVIVWSDDYTQFYGAISAHGGLQSGNGGYVETSGKQTLNFAGSVDTSAPNGKTGTLLLDPADIVIADAAVGSQSQDSYGGSIAFSDGGGVGTFTISTGTLEALTASTSISLNANNTITMGPIVGIAGGGGAASANMLTLQQNGSVSMWALNGNINLGSSNTINIVGTGSLNLMAGSTINVGPIITHSGSVTLTSGASNAASSSVLSGGNITTNGGSITLTGGPYGTTGFTVGAIDTSNSAVGSPGTNSGSPGPGGNGGVYSGSPGPGGNAGVGGSGGVVAITAASSIATGSITTTGGLGGIGGISAGDPSFVVPYRGGTGGNGGNGGDVVLSVAGGIITTTGDINTSGGQGGAGGNSNGSTTANAYNQGGNAGTGGSGGLVAFKFTGGSIDDSAPLIFVNAPTGTIKTSGGLSNTTVGRNSGCGGCNPGYAGAHGVSGNVNIAATNGDFTFITGTLPIAFGSIITTSNGNASTDGSLRLTANNNININASTLSLPSGVNTGSGGSIQFNGSNVYFNGDAVIAGPQNAKVQFRAANNMYLNGDYVDGVSSPGSTAHTITASAQNLSFSANDDLTQPSATLNTASGTGLIIGGGNIITGGGNVTLSGYGVAVGALNTSGPSDGNVGITTSGGDISTGTITTDALNPNGGAGSVTLTTTGGHISVTGDIDARGANGNSTYKRGSSGSNVNLIRTGTTAPSAGDAVHVTGSILTYGGDALAGSGSNGGGGGGSVNVAATNISSPTALLGNIAVDGFIDTHGGNVSSATGGNGGRGGDGGSVLLAGNGIVTAGAISTYGGDGGNSGLGYGGSYSYGGNGGTAKLYGSSVTANGSIDTHGGVGGDGGISSGYCSECPSGAGRGGAGGYVNLGADNNHVSVNDASSTPVITSAVHVSGSIDAHGGNGGMGLADDGNSGAGNGGYGGQGGAVTLAGTGTITVDSDILTYGGAGETGGTAGSSGYRGGAGGNAGYGGYVYLDALGGAVNTGDIDTHGGNGGNAGVGAFGLYGGDGGWGGSVEIHNTSSILTGLITTRGGDGGQGGADDLYANNNQYNSNYSGHIGAGWGGDGGGVNLQSTGAIIVGAIDVSGGNGGSSGLAPDRKTYSAGSGGNGGNAAYDWKYDTVYDVSISLGVSIAIGAGTGTVTAQGGNGGAGSGPSYYGGNGGDGANVSLSASSATGGFVRTGAIYTTGGSGGFSSGIPGVSGSDRNWNANGDSVTIAADNYDFMAQGSVSASTFEFDPINLSSLLISQSSFVPISSVRTVKFGKDDGTTSTDLVLTGTIDLTGSPLINTLSLKTTGDVAIAGNVQADATVGISGTGITLGTAGSVSSNATGDAITLVSGGAFTNNNVTNALSAPNGRWLIYAPDPLSVTKNGLTSVFRQYNTVYGGAINSATGNGFVYASAPGALSVDTTLVSGTASNTYGSTPTATFDFTLRGFADSEDNASNIGLAGIAAFTPTFVAKTNAGSYLVTYASGLTSSTGYGYGFVAGTGLAYTVNPAMLTATVAAPNKVYNGNTTAAPTLSITGGLVGTETVSATGTASFNTKDVLTANLVTVNSTALANGINGGLASNYSLATGQTVAANITAAPLTATVAAPNKVYNGNTTAAPTLSITAGLVDTETVSATGTATFNTKDVLTANLVTVNSTALANGINGDLASNYSLTPGQTVAANITQQALTATVAAPNKVYNGNTTAAPTLSITGGLVSGETVSATGTASFNTKDVLTANLVTVNSTALANGINGGLASNYSLATGQTVAANITAAPLTATVAAPNKVYNGNTTAAPTLSITGGLVGTETVSATGTASFNTKDVLTANLVTVNSTALANGINGGLASNYSLATGEAVTAQITARGITGSITADNKVYDATTAAAISSRAVTGVIGGDTVSLSGGTASFADKNAATGKTVTATGLVLAGIDAGNYTLSGTTAATTADITVRPLSTWIGGASGNWSVAANWDALPDLSNVLAVTVPTGKSVTYDAATGSTNLASLTAAGLSIAGGSLNIANSLTVNSNFSQTGGTLGDFGGGSSASITQATGNLTLPTITVANLSLNAPAGAITQSGRIAALTLNTQSQGATTLNNPANQVSNRVDMTSGGPLILWASGDLNLGAINAGANPVEIKAGGAILKAPGTETSTNIIAGAANLASIFGGKSGDLAISTDTQLTGALTATVGSAADFGGIRIKNTGAQPTSVTLIDNALAGAGVSFLNTGNITSTSGFTLKTLTGGDLALLSNGNLTWDGGSLVTPSGSVLMSADGTIAVTGALSSPVDLALSSIVAINVNAGGSVSTAGSGTAAFTAPSVVINGSVNAADDVGIIAGTINLGAGSHTSAGHDVIFAAGNVMATNATVAAGHDISAAVTGDLRLNGSGFTAGNDIFIKMLGATSTLYLNDVTGLTRAFIWAQAPATIHLDFPARIADGMMVDGVAADPLTFAAAAGASGLFYGATMAPATLGTGLEVTYANGTGMLGGTTVALTVVDAVMAAINRPTNPLPPGTFGPNLGPQTGSGGTLGSGEIGGTEGTFGGDDNDSNKTDKETGLKKQADKPTIKKLATCS